MFAHVVRRGSVPSDTQVWETPLGTYFGINIPVENKAIDDLEHLWGTMQEWESSDLEEDDYDYWDESEDDF